MAISIWALLLLPGDVARDQLGSIGKCFLKMPDGNAGGHHRVLKSRACPFDGCGEEASAASLDIPHHAVLALPVMHSD